MLVTGEEEDYQQQQQQCSYSVRSEWIEPIPTLLPSYEATWPTATRHEPFFLLVLPMMRIKRRVVVATTAPWPHYRAAGYYVATRLQYNLLWHVRWASWLDARGDTSAAVHEGQGAASIHCQYRHFCYWLQRSIQTPPQNKPRWSSLLLLLLLLLLSVVYL